MVHLSPGEQFYGGGVVVVMVFGGAGDIHKIQVVFFFFLLSAFISSEAILTQSCNTSLGFGVVYNTKKVSTKGDKFSLSPS